MDSIRLLQLTSLIGSMVFKRDLADSASSAQMKEAQSAVSQENKLAALDYSVLSGSLLSDTGSFTFSWAQNEDGSATLDISYKNTATSSTTPVEGESTSNFSLQISIAANGTVQLPDEIAVDAQQIQGVDFTFSSTGVLQLQNDLAERLGNDDTAQVDLKGQLDDETLSMLKRLGLIDQNGKATQLLQFLSDYAGLDRFKAGQQVSRSAETSYGLSDKALSLQRQVLQSLKLMATLAIASAAEAETASGTGDAAPPATATDVTDAAEINTTAATQAAEDATAVGQAAVPVAASSEDSDVASTAPETEATATTTARAPETAALAAAAGQAPAAATSSSTDSATLEALIASLEAAQREKEQAAEAAQRAANQAAISAARIKQSSTDAERIRVVEQDASKAQQVAAQAQQAAVLAQVAVQNAKLQQEQLSSQVSG
jgi:hypothetical protein